MPKNIESFVETLKAEGVEAGKQAAEKIEAEARASADKIVAEAEAQAKQVIADAEAEAQKTQARLDSSLELAARDAVLKLRDDLGKLLSALLAREVEGQLSDEETLAGLLREVILAYAKTAGDKEPSAEIHLPAHMQSRLVTGALRELTRALKSQEIQTEVKANLEKAGFEYKIEGSTVEVSVDSVTQLLADMVDPEMQQIMDKAMA